MASNKFYSLTGDLMELKSCDKNKKQSKGVKLGGKEPVYLNTTQTKGEGKRDAAENYYETLPTVENNEDTSVETDIIKQKVNQQRENRLVPALLGMVVVLFVLFGAVAGICVWLAIKISKEQSTSHFYKDGGWSSWSNWTECTVTCGYGVIKRTRECNNPEPSALGRGCVGNDEQVTICNPLKCPDCTISSCEKVPKFNGTYDIYPGDKCNRMVVYCDQTTDGGGWIVIQRRKDGSVDFERTWADYKSGFGDLEGEFWLGNDNIYTLTTDGFNELRIDMEDFEGTRAFAKYSNFSIKSEIDNYTLTVSGYSGDAGDSLAYHSGMAFSTKDRDNDLNDSNSSSSCAFHYKGAWWYSDCHRSNLNGYYYHGAGSPYGRGITWYFWKNDHRYSLKFVEMKIR